MKLKIDDPVACVPVHGMCGFFGMVVVGLSGERELEEKVALQYGVLKGGPWSYLGYQTLACVVISAWSAVTTFIQVTYFVFFCRYVRGREIFIVELNAGTVWNMHSRIHQKLS